LKDVRGDVREWRGGVWWGKEDILAIEKGETKANNSQKINAKKGNKFEEKGNEVSLRRRCERSERCIRPT